jgi:hypothetical protein
MAKPFGGVITLDGTAQNIAEELTLTPDESVGMCTNLSIQAGSGNSNPVFIGDASVTGATDAWAVLSSGGANYAFILNQTHLNIGSLYVLGTGTETVHILAVQ